MVHMILISDLKKAQPSARYIPHLLLEDDCAINHASYKCKLTEVLIVIQMACTGGPDL